MTTKNINSYYGWFKKVITIFIELFFIGAVLSTLYVFTYPFDENIKIYIFIGIILVFGILVFILKEKVKYYIDIVLEKFKTIDCRKMLLIIVITAIVLKVIYSAFFYYDPTIGDDSDIALYNQIAEGIYKTGTFNSNQISHLLGVSLHLALFKFIGIPNHIGVFIVILIGIIVNFISFKNIVGKEKSFLLTMIYVLMPSTMLLTFCPTHEIFVFTYMSLSMFFINNVIKEEKYSKQIIFGILSILFIVLTCFVNPAGNLVLIVIALIILLSNIKHIKKIILVCVLVISLFTSNFISNSLSPNSLATDSNTYSILIHGSSIESMGEHVDKYPAHKAEEYMKDNNIEFSFENQLEAYKAVLKEQYVYLLTHPIDLFRLLIHKFYVEWSGNHYSIEMAHNFSGISNMTYYIFLVFNTLIYLFVITVGLVLNKDKEDEIYISNYKVLLLGIVGLLLVTLVLNKYSVYATLFIYLISFYRFGINNN